MKFNIVDLIFELDENAKNELAFAPQYIPNHLSFIAAREIERLRALTAKLRERKADELDGHEELFGWKYSEDESTGLVTIYVKEDENWHSKMTFDRLWANDFRKMALHIVHKKLHIVHKKR